MFVLSATVVPVIVAQLLASAQVARTRPAAADTSVASANASDDSIAARIDTTPPARLSFDFGLGLGQPVNARSFDFGVASAPSSAIKNQQTTTTQVRFVRAPDALSAELARRVASGEHIAQVDAQLEGTNGMPAVVLHLYDVQVMSSHLVVNQDNTALVQQRLGLVESIAQMTVDLQEAERQLDVTESLDKHRLSSSLELARARASAQVLAKRLALQRQRLAIVERQLQQWTPIQEDVVLAVGRMEMETR